MSASRKLSRSTRRSLCKAILEALEPRQLMAADLTATITSFGAGPFAVGTKQPATLRHHQRGYEGGERAIDLYAMITMVPFDPNTATLLGRVNASININASASQDVVVQVPISPALGPAGYVLDAVIDSLNKIPESDNSNNTASGPGFSATPLNVDLVPSFGPRTIPAGLVEGDLTAGTAHGDVLNSTTGTDKIIAGTGVGVSGGAAGRRGGKRERCCSE